MKNEKENEKKMKSRAEKKVSMIVPVYNAASTLRRCMESLLAQTYRNTEILLIDDGSTDESGRLCEEYARKYDRVRAVHIPNEGVSAARNKGIELCDGAYLTFVDADDCAAEDMVAQLVQMLEHSGSDVAGCGYFTFTEKAKPQNEAPQSGSCVDVELLTGAAFIENGILKSDTRCWSKLYKRESIGTLRFDQSLTIGEDMLFLLELARTERQFCRSAYQGYGYYVNTDGAMLQQFKDSYLDQITCWQKALELIKAKKPELTAQTEAILLISVMLVAGKLAMLSPKERKKKAAVAGYCSGLVKEYSKKKEVFRQLDKGYKIKVLMYRYLPGTYMTLYHWKGSSYDRG